MINKKMKKELKKLRDMSDDEIDYSDISPITETTGWEPNPFFKLVKAQISAKLDKDVILCIIIYNFFKF